VSTRRTIYMYSVSGTSKLVSSTRSHARMHSHQGRCVHGIVARRRTPRVHGIVHAGAKSPRCEIAVQNHPAGRRIAGAGPAGRLQQRALQVTLYSCTVPLLNSPWSSPKKFRFRKFWRSYLDQNLPRITNPVSDLTGDQ
jgi:hypothetical protein